MSYSHGESSEQIVTDNDKSSELMSYVTGYHRASLAYNSMLMPMEHRMPSPIDTRVHL